MVDRAMALNTSRTLLGAAAMFVVLQFGVTLLAGQLDLTSASLVGGAVVVATAVGLECWRSRCAAGEALRRLGFGRPAPRAVFVAAAVGGLMLLFFPVWSAVTQTPLTVKADWWWVLLGAAALNGIGEETLFRGWVFGGLRRGGLTFRRATLLSMAVFASIHLLLFFSLPPVVAAGTLVVALAASFPMAWLYEQGGGTLWAPALLHLAGHAVRLVEIPPAAQTTVLSAWVGVQLFAGFLVFVLRARPAGQ